MQHALAIRGIEADRVSILTGLERPVQRASWCGISPRRGASFQSSPALKDRCNEAGGGHCAVQPAVSILTGLERPVQRDVHGLDLIRRRPVSILTGLERPVQRKALEAELTRRYGFNPHRP